MVTIGETDKITGLVTGVNCLSTDTLTSDVNGVGVSNGCSALVMDTGDVLVYDKENSTWIAM
jgi:hypothetical protein